jgi:hypothetical protein
MVAALLRDQSGGNGGDVSTLNPAASNIRGGQSSGGVTLSQGTTYAPSHICLSNASQAMTQ